jgi:hypothetical protein
MSNAFFTTFESRRDSTQTLEPAYYGPSIPSTCSSSGTSLQDEIALPPTYSSGRIMSCILQPTPIYHQDVYFPHLDPDSDYTDGSEFASLSASSDSLDERFPSPFIDHIFSDPDNIRDECDTPVRPVTPGPEQSRTFSLHQSYLWSTTVPHITEPWKIQNRNAWFITNYGKPEYATSLSNPLDKKSKKHNFVRCSFAKIGAKFSRRIGAFSCHSCRPLSSTTPRIHKQQAKNLSTQNKQKLFLNTLEELSLWKKMLKKVDREIIRARDRKNATHELEIPEHEQQGLFNLVDAETLSTLDEINETLRNGVKINHNFTSDIFGAIQNTNHNIAKTGEKLRNAVSGATGEFSTFSSVLLITLSLIYFNSNRDSTMAKIVLALSIMNLVRTIKICDVNLLTLLKKTITYCMSYFTKTEHTQQMSTGDFTDLTKGLLLFGMVGDLSTSSSWDSLLNDTVKKIEGFDKKASSFESFFKFGLSLIERAVNIIRTKLLNEPTLQFFSSSHIEIERLQTEWKVIVDEIALSKFVYDVDNYIRTQDLLTRVQKYMRELPRNSQTSSMSATLTLLHNDINRLIHKLRDMQLDIDGFRQEPVVVELFGSPGVGKTSVVRHLLGAILGDIVRREWQDQYDKTPHKFTYIRQAEQGYWDAWKNQMCGMFIDDFGQMTDIAGNPDNEYMNLFRAANTAPNNLHRAEMEHKGNSWFQCQLIVLTTNVNQYTPASIISPEGLTRRMDVPLEVKVRPEYARKADMSNTMVLDPSKLPLDPDTGRTSFSPHFLEYHEMRYDHTYTKVPTGRIFSFDELVNLLKRKIQFKKEAHEQSLVDIKKTQKQYTSRLQPKPSYMQENPDIFMDAVDHHKQQGLFSQKPDPIDSIGADLVDMVPDKERTIFNDYLSTIFGGVTGFCYNQRAIAGFMRLIYGDFADDIYKDGTVETLFMLVHAPETTNKPCLNWDSIHQAIASHTSMLKPRFDFPKASEVLASIRNALSDALSKVSSFLIEYNPIADLDFIGSITRAYNAILTYFKAHAEMIGLLVGATAFISFITLIFKQLSSKDNISTLEYLPSYDGGRTESEIRFCHTCQFKYHREHDYKKAMTFKLPCDPEDQPFVAHWDPMNVVQSDVRTKQKQPQRSRRTTVRPAVRLHQGNLLSREEPSHSDSYLNQLVQQSTQRHDPTCYDLTRKLLARNHYSMQTWDGTAFKHVGYATIIRDNIALINYHYIRHFQAEIAACPEQAYDTFNLVSVVNPKISWEIPFSVFRKFSSTSNPLGHDVALVAFDRKIGCHADFVPHFITESDLHQRQFMDIRLSIASEVPETWFGKGRVTYGRRTKTSKNDYVTYPRTIDYDAPTTAGDCGSILAIVDPASAGRKFAGIHTSGNGHDGSSVTVTQEMLREMLSSMKNVKVEPLEASTMQQSDTLPVPGRYKLMYEHELRANAASKSKIIASPLYGDYKVATTAPAQLKPFKDSLGNTILPYNNAIKKYCPPDRYLPPTLLSYIGECVGNDLLATSKHRVHPRAYTYEEAAAGLAADPDFKSINLATSAGFPFTHDTMGKKGKTAFFNFEEDIDFASPAGKKLHKHVMSQIALMKQGTRPEFIFADNLKDERRKLAKVESGATRLISAAPIDLLLLSRMYFGAFSLWMFKNRIDNGCCVGVNPYQEWGNLANALSKHADADMKCFGAGDYSAFDASEHPDIHWVILDIINRWYNDDDNDIRAMLWLEVVNSKHIIGNQVYQWFASLASGHPMTPVINNLYNHVVFRYCYYRAKGNDLAALADFNLEVYLAVFGDDNIFGINPDIAEIFNEATICEFMAELGLTYTNESKTGVSHTLRTLFDCSFLKRGFRYDDTLNRVVAPLELDVITEMVLWTKNTADKDAIVKTNVETALMELSLHGLEVFNTHAPAMIACYNKYYETPLRLTAYLPILYKASKHQAFL